MRAFKSAALVLIAIALVAVPAPSAAPASRSVLFIGNSFTFGQGAAVHFWQADTVHDLNNEGIGGVPALFKAFAVEAGLDYDVSLETHPGVGLDWHLANKRDVLSSRPWDVVVMHGFSTLDSAKPGDPTTLISTSKDMAALLRATNARVEIHATATWSRADQTYPEGRPWFGKPIEMMAIDVRAGYDKAAAATPAISSIAPVGEAWNRAMKTGLADPNPYDGVDAGKINLWAEDNYHASAYGYYLEALVVFADVTRLDPRWLGTGECAAFELGFSGAKVRALQQVAFDQMTSAPNVKLDTSTAKPPAAGRCKR